MMLGMSDHQQSCGVAVGAQPSAGMRMFSSRNGVCSLLIEGTLVMDTSVQITDRAGKPYAGTSLMLCIGHIRIAALWCGTSVRGTRRKSLSGIGPK